MGMYCLQLHLYTVTGMHKPGGPYKTFHVPNTMAFWDDMYTVLINFVRPLSPASLYVDEIQAILNNLFGQLSKKKFFSQHYHGRI